MTSMFSWQNSISLCPASFHTPRPNFPVSPGVSWLPTFPSLSPIMERTFLGVLILEGLLGLHRTIHLQLLQHYCDTEWFALEISRDHSIVFETTSKYWHGKTDWFKMGKIACQGCILSTCLSNLYAEYIMWDAGLDESQAGIKIAGRNISNLRYVDDTSLMA